MPQKQLDVPGGDMRSLLQDLRYGWRQLRGNPGVSITAILSLALGIAATTAVFSVVYAVIMHPYPYRAADRMVHLRLRDKAGVANGFGLTAQQWQELRKSPAVEDSFLTDGASLTLTGHDLPEEVTACSITSNGFAFFGVPMALGRGILPSDGPDNFHPQPVVVLSYKFWQRHFNGNADVVGQTIQLTRKTYTIVGVAPSRFTWRSADVYMPMDFSTGSENPYSVGLRLKPGVSHAMAESALAPLIDQFAKQTPNNFPQPPFKFFVIGLNDEFIQRLGGTLALLFCAVGLLLAIGCGNVSILLLARGTAREQEFALRSAVGASRSRIVRQLLTEACLLSLTGAALGVLLAFRLVALMVTMLPEGFFPQEASIHINLPVLAFSVAVALLTGIVFGAWPALALSRPDLRGVMQTGSRRLAGHLGTRAANNTLIAGQIALTLLMLAGSGAAIRSFLRMMHTPLGYDPHNVLAVEMPVNYATYNNWEKRARYYEAMRETMSRVPGVTTTAISETATPPSSGWITRLEFQGVKPIDIQRANVGFVNETYFPLLGIPLVQGRLWDATENRNAAHLAVVNETLAKRYFPKGAAVGHLVRVPELVEQPPYVLDSPGTDGSWLRIVGVVADKRNNGMRDPVLPEIYMPFTHSMDQSVLILARSSVPPLTLLHAIVKQIDAIDPEQTVHNNIRDLDQWITTQPEWQQERLVAWLFGVFALLGLGLAAAGLYSVVSYTVAQRTGEFGIRMALGAPREHVLLIVYRSTMVSLGCGIAVGLGLALGLSQLLAHWADGSTRDPMLLGVVTLLLGAVAGIACALPAWRACLVEPAVALRSE
jgi:putative ABC transport system permease protein